MAEELHGTAAQGQGSLLNAQELHLTAQRELELRISAVAGVDNSKIRGFAFRFTVRPTLLFVLGLDFKAQGGPGFELGAGKNPMDRLRV